MIEKITSTQNAKVKKWQHLTTKKGHQKYHQYLVEGWHTVGDALTAHEPVQTLIATGEQLDAHQNDLPDTIEQIEITEEIAKKLTDTVTPQGIFAVVNITAQPGWHRPMLMVLGCCWTGFRIRVISALWSGPLTQQALLALSLAKGPPVVLIRK